MVNVWFAFVLIVICMIVSFIIGYRIGEKDGETIDVSGELVIAKDEDGIYPFLRVQDNPENFLKKEYVTFKVAKK